MTFLGVGVADQKDDVTVVCAVGHLGHGVEQVLIMLDRHHSLAFVGVHCGHERRAIVRGQEARVRQFRQTRQSATRQEPLRRRCCGCGGLVDRRLVLIGAWAAGREGYQESYCRVSLQGRSVRFAWRRLDLQGLRLPGCPRTL